MKTARHPIRAKTAKRRKRAESLKGVPACIPRQWAWYYKTLVSFREKLLQERDEHEVEARAPLERGGADDADRAEDKCEHDVLMAELRLEETELAEIEAALERIRRGTYGTCELTGKPISLARLRAIPWTRYSQRAANHVTNRLQR